jgi:hypothetical protein
VQEGWVQPRDAAGAPAVGEGRDARAARELQPCAHDHALLCALYREGISEQHPHSTHEPVPSRTHANYGARDHVTLTSVRVQLSDVGFVTGHPVQRPAGGMQPRCSQRRSAGSAVQNIAFRRGGACRPPPSQLALKRPGAFRCTWWLHTCVHGYGRPSPRRLPSVLARSIALGRAGGGAAGLGSMGERVRRVELHAAAVQRRLELLAACALAGSFFRDQNELGGTHPPLYRCCS